MSPLTTAEKQSRRITELDAIAQAAGWATWTRYATAVKRGVVSIATNPKGDDLMKCDSCGRTAEVKSVKRGQMDSVNLCAICREDKRSKVYQEYLRKKRHQIA